MIGTLKKTVGKLMPASKPSIIVPGLMPDENIVPKPKVIKQEPVPEPEIIEETEDEDDPESIQDDSEELVDEPAGEKTLEDVIHNQETIVENQREIYTMLTVVLENQTVLNTMMMRILAAMDPQFNLDMEKARENKEQPRARASQPRPK